MKLPHIIGICGYARVGKNTAAEQIKEIFPEKKIEMLGYSDCLKADLVRCVNWAQEQNIDTTTAKFKEQIRPMFVLWSRVAKTITNDELIWVHRNEPRIQKNIARNIVSIMTDVRYHYEIEDILNKGGLVIFINRPAHHAKNDEEKESFALIKQKYRSLMTQCTVLNNGTKNQLRENIKKILEKGGHW